MISGMRPPRLFSTCSARVGLIEPLALADGAARGRAAVAQQRLHRRMRRHAKADGRKAGGDDGGDPGMWPKRNHQRQRTRPIALSQVASLAPELADPLGGRKVRHMHDQRVEAWSSLGLVDARYCLGVGRVGCEPIDSLGRNRDRLAGEDQPGGFCDALVAEWKDWRFGHAELVSASIVREVVPFTKMDPETSQGDTEG